MASPEKNQCAKGPRQQEWGVWPTLSELRLAYTPFTTIKGHIKGFCGLKPSRGFRNVPHFLTAYLDLEDFTVSITQEPSWRRLCYLAGLLSCCFLSGPPQSYQQAVSSMMPTSHLPQDSPWSQSSHPVAPCPPQAMPRSQSGNKTGETLQTEYRTLTQRQGCSSLSKLFPVHTELSMAWSLGDTVAHARDSDWAGDSSHQAGDRSHTAY